MRVFDGIGPVLDFMAIRTAANVAEAVEQGAMELEMYAKFNAPWADRTGEARNGLTASVYEEGGEIVLELAHSVDYGIWLELIQDGRFAIIMPTLEALGPRIIRDAGGRVMDTGGAH
jgi:hypothetical protein